MASRDLTTIFRDKRVKYAIDRRITSSSSSQPQEKKQESLYFPFIYLAQVSKVNHFIYSFHMELIQIYTENYKKN